MWHIFWIFVIMYLLFGMHIEVSYVDKDTQRQGKWIIEFVRISKE